MAGLTDEQILEEGLDALNNEELEEVESLLIDQLGDITFYIRCQDRLGNSNQAEYVIRTCGEEGPDFTEPIITHYWRNSE